MNRPLRVQQLFHGYRRGHEQLAGSTKLSEPDSDLVTRLSDLSGTPLSGFVFKSYLTMYPLPSSKFYAVALTQPDPTATRAGCVLTHTLLVDIDEWSTLAAPKGISSLFFETPMVPPRPLAALDHVAGTSLVHSERWNVSPQEDDFVGRYFGEGIRPVIWFDAQNPDETLWAIVGGLWPALRRSFSACTLCLQPRSFEGRMFDLMFAPSAARSRFSRLSDDHLICSTPLTSEAWHHDFAIQLFGHPSSVPADRLVLATLDDNPMSVRKLFLFRELWNRSADKPTAAIGVFDILESINAPQATAQLQSTALNRAISSFGSLSTRERLELFSMLVIRMSRVPAGGDRLDATFKNLLDVVIKEVLLESPDEVLSQIEPIWPKLREEDSFRNAFITELAVALPENPTVAVAIVRHSDIGKEVAIKYPVAFAKALNVPDAQLLREQALNWFSELPFRERLHGVRVRLLKELQIHRNVVLFRKILIGIHEDEVVPVLNALFEDDGRIAPQNDKAIEVVIELIARPFPALTREWIESWERRDKVLAEILSATYPPDPAEYSKILDRGAYVFGLGDLVFAYWIVRNSIHDSQFLNGLSDCASRDRRIVGALIKPEHSDEIDKALEILIDSLSSFPIDAELVARAFLHRPYNFKFADFVIRTAAGRYVRSGESLDALEKVLEQKEFIQWLSSAQTWRLAELIRAGISAPDSCARGWEVLCKLPGTAFTRDTIVGTIESLLSLTAQYYSPVVAETWVAIIARARNLSSDEAFEVDLSGQAVRFAFDNPHLAVSGLVVETFMPLYKFVTVVKRVPVTALSLFSFWNWDRGSELRESLAEKFLLGKWPAGDLALAVRDYGLLKKILKRMSRKSGGQSFAQKMYSDLVSRKDKQSRALASSVASLLKNADYDEDWD